jgi:DNA-binding transcriptional LysR family regulator
MANFDQLKSFKAVVELESFSAAADKAGLSQPAISLQIRQLEKEFGVALIERVGRKPRPTFAGTELLPYVLQLCSTMDAMRSEMARHSSSAPARIRLGTGATASIYFLPRILSDLRSRFPDMEFVINTGNAADITRSVEDSVIDLGLVTLPISGRTLETIPILRDEFVAISPASDDSLPAVVAASTLQGCSLILFEAAGNSRALIDNWLAQSASPIKPKMSLGSVEAIKELVAAGLGISIIPAMAVREADKRLRAKSLSPKLYRELAIVVRRDRPIRRGLRELIRALQRKW